MKGGQPGDQSVRLARLHLSEGEAASPTSIDAVRRELGDLNRYPDPAYTELTAAIADRWSVDAENVAIGNGSDELILLSALALGDRVRPGVVSAGTFAGHRFALEVAGRGVREVPLAGSQVDVPGFTRAMRGAGIAFACTPHNPSGVALDDSQLRAVLDAATDADIPLVADEAYMEFAPVGTPSTAALAGRRVLTLRTFSKAYGLAGIRVGYAIGDAREIAAIREAQRVLPFRVNRLGQAAALAALADAACLERVHAETARKRDWLTGVLMAAGFTVQPSATNFVTVAVDDAAATALMLLNAYGIAVRDTADMGYIGHIRISLGEHRELERVVSALIEIGAHDD